MGGTRWSDDHYRDRAARLHKAKRSAFEYDEDIRERRVKAGVHELMDPAKMKNGIRESRDSEAHPNSNAVAVMFDVTGSMQRVPRILQKNLPTLMGLCLRNGYLDDPAILIGAIGDATCDLVPLQLGQFESGNEIENDLSRLYLEGGGGGQQMESYELALYFLARKAVMDSLEKRGKKGYAFIIGDEMPYKKVKRREVEKVFGETLQADIPIREIIAEAQEKFEIYFVLPNMTSYYNDPKILDCWRDLLGQYVLRLEDPAGISELIASTIGLSEEAVAYDNLSTDLGGAGANQSVADAVSAALADIAPNKIPKNSGLTSF
ncbi:MAG: hypothetical protein KDA84_17675 [Planctomycetaceae bacterium]|nr:hypothetical protein [Planctomycetaceae bacterium]